MGENDSTPAFDASAPYYDAIYAARGKNYRAETEYLLRAAEEVAGHKPESLLDVACGTGEHLLYFSKDMNVTGFDQNHAMLAVAKDKLPDVALHQGDMTSMKLGQTYDIVTCLFASIAYLPDIAAMGLAIERMAAHLAPDGILLIEPGVMRERIEPPRVEVDKFVLGNETVRRSTSAKIESSTLIIQFQFEIDGGKQVRSFIEHHVILLPRLDDYKLLFEKAGLKTQYDEQGPAGKGLFLAHLNQ